MSNYKPTHLVSPDGVRVPVSSAVDIVNLRSRGYRDLNRVEAAQLAVEQASLAVERARKEPSASRESVEQAQREHRLAVEKAEQLLAAEAAAADPTKTAPDAPVEAPADGGAEVPATNEVAPARTSRAAKPSAK
ncbi:hypothetical protein P9990_17550 [Prescottella equi]|uniref:hypothetical protein n=1 Tax=Rhodococcus hoagii TaxID=43767 RepID=UPI002576C33A|nr:hypothetical protein [Prescottella equi]WJJ10377.1 hypothetical protein P9990_17550 [Prescottella equi]